MPLARYLDLTKHFCAERDQNVWSVLISSFHALNRVVTASDRPRLAALVRDRLGPVLAVLGWNPHLAESELTRRLRGDLIRALGTLGNDVAVQHRAADFYALADVDADVLAGAIPVLAYTGDEARYAEYLHRFRSAATPQEEQRFLYALAAFRSPPLVEQTLTRTLNGEFRTQDAPYVVRALLRSVHGRELAWSFVKLNWEAMSRDFPVTGIRRMFEGVTALATPEQERDVRAFFMERKIDLGGKTLEQYLEQLRIAVRLRERDGPALADYLATMTGSVV
jgi:puromycin-sensitive aminopeptidase